jgi:hypothetical protein
VLGGVRAKEIGNVFRPFPSNVTIMKLILAKHVGERSRHLVPPADRVAVGGGMREMLADRGIRHAMDGRLNAAN